MKNEPRQAQPKKEKKVEEKDNNYGDDYDMYGDEDYGNYGEEDDFGSDNDIPIKYANQGKGLPQ